MYKYSIYLLTMVLSCQKNPSIINDSHSLGQLDELLGRYEKEEVVLAKCHYNREVHILEKAQITSDWKINFYASVCENLRYDLTPVKKYEKVNFYDLNSVTRSNPNSPENPQLITANETCVKINHRKLGEYTGKVKDIAYSSSNDKYYIKVDTSSFIQYPENSPVGILTPDHVLATSYLEIDKNVESIESNYCY